MRVLIVHSYYGRDQVSGENVAAEAHAAALLRAGHEVLLVAQHTDERESSALYPLVAAATVASGFGPSPAGAIADFRPDIVHVHNLFPNFGRRWVNRVRVPLVHTLHNFRPLCAAATLFRDGHVCTLCPGGQRWSGVRYACYRDSRLRTLPLAIGNRRGPKDDPVLNAAAAVVVLSELSRRVYEDAGVPATKLVCIPNFVLEELAPSREESPGGSAWLYVGRLSPEKGIDLLVEKWPARIPLQIVGQGSLAPDVAAAARGKNVELLGSRSSEEVLELMRRSLGLVFPSRWYEGFPLVYAEAMATGLPVLAFEPSSVAEFVRADETGLVTTWNESLPHALASATERFPALRRACRMIFEGNYSERTFVQRMTSLYSKVAR